jgi:phosphatidate cytidylyltransferase
VARAEPQAAPAAHVRRRWPGLGARLLAAAVFIPCFAIITWRGSVFFVSLVNLIALLATFEFERLLEAKGLRAQRGTAVVAAIALPWLAFWRGGEYADLGLLLLMVCSMAQELGRPIADALLRTAGAAFGVVYVAWLPSFLVRLREAPLTTGAPYVQGGAWVLFVFLIAWMSDAGAYAVGSAIGRHKLAPRISPGKSVEGAIGGLLFAIVAGAVAAPLLMRGILTPLAGGAFGLLGSVAGQIGDLVESQLKRDAQVKDASGAIPGHGGMLDRFDSVFFAAPLVYFVLRLAAS